MRLLLTQGDPAGIGPETLLAALRRYSKPAGVELAVVGDSTYLRSLSRRLKISLPWSRFTWIDCVEVGRFSLGKVQPKTGRAAYACLAEAVRRVKRGQADALVTAPVSKEAIVRAGLSWRGHTEFLADAFRSPATMMFVTGRFRASLVTTHWALREVPARLRRAEVARILKATHRALVRDFGISRPRLGLAALNPHAGEGGIFGEEEKRVLIPAVKSVPFRVEGPLACDSLIQAASLGRYDAVVALYHDQALIPVKLLGWDQAVNVTLGLPFVRTSPVHGTAFDLAGKGKAQSDSMLAALKLAVELVRRRKRMPC